MNKRLLEIVEDLASVRHVYVHKGNHYYDIPTVAQILRVSPRFIRKLIKENFFGEVLKPQHMRGAYISVESIERLPNTANNPYK